MTGFLGWAGRRIAATGILALSCHEVNREVSSAVLEILTYFRIRCGFCAPATHELTALA